MLANRVWHYHFGCGLVDTPSDFGYMGGRPTHPELLDYLARELLAGGWRLKPLHRLIMTSQAYRQASTWRAGPAGLDADSRWLWRYPPRRLEAEELRDALLAVSGSLQMTLGGPGFRLYEYEVDNVATYVPLDVQGPETYRRAVYHQNARASRVDLLGEFDCPDNSFSAPRRAATTTPLQSLTLLNHSFVLDMASALAARLESERPSDVRAQVDRAFWLAAWAGRPSVRSLTRPRSSLASTACGRFAGRCSTRMSSSTCARNRETYEKQVKHRETVEPGLQPGDCFTAGPARRMHWKPLMTNLLDGLSRRQFLGNVYTGLAGIGLAQLLGGEGSAASMPAWQPGQGQTHFAPKAKRVLQIFHARAPASHIDLWEHKHRTGKAPTVSRFPAEKTSSRSRAKTAT